MYVGHIENYVCQSYCICKSSKDARVAHIAPQLSRAHVPRVHREKLGTVFVRMEFSAAK